MSAGEDTVDVLVGRVGRAHGIRGEVSVTPRTDEPERRFALGAVLSTERGPLTVGATRWHQSKLLVRFEQVTDRTTAETLRGLDLRVDVPVDERPEDPEEFYDHQLLGLRAESDQGSQLGEVTDVLHLPMQDVLVVSTGQSDHLVPFVSEIVREVDVTARRVVIAVVPGLFDDAEA